MKRPIVVVLIFALSLSSSAQVIGGVAKQGGVSVFAGGVTAGGGAGTFTFVSTAGHMQTCNGSGLTCFSAITLTSGSSVILGVVWNSPTNTMSCADPTNGTWTSIGSRQTGTGSLAAYSGQFFWVPANAASGGVTITCTSSGTNTFFLWQAWEYTHSGGATPVLDGTPVYNNVTASTTTPFPATIGTVTTTGATDLLIAGCFAVDSSCAAGTGFTARDQGGGGSFFGVSGGLFEENNGVAAGTQSATFNQGSGNNSILGLFAIK